MSGSPIAEKRDMGKFNRLLIGLVSLVLSLSCTRPSNDGQSSLNFAFPKTYSKVGAQNEQLLTDVIVNISGPGIENSILLNWSSERPSDLCDSGGRCSFMAPIGKDRLIQVLGIYKNSSSESFLYGDRMTSIESSNPPLELPVQSIFSGDNIVEADITGRFLTSENAGPTGFLEIKFKPEGKPAMQLMRSEMVNGWFRAFALSGVKFQYSIGDLILFGGPKSLGELRDPLSPQRLEVSWPRYYSVHGDAESTRQESRPRNAILGYFGPGAQNKKVCFSTTPGSLSHSYANTTGSDLISYDPFSTDAAKVRVLANPSRPNNCAGMTPIVGYLDFNPIRDGQESSRGIYMRGDSGRYLSSSVVDGVHRISWNVLPGVNEVLSGYHVFRILNGSLDSFRLIGGDALNCQRIFDDRSKLSSQLQYLGASNSTAMTMNIEASHLSSRFLICPFNSQRVFQTTLVENLQTAGMSSENGPPTKISLFHRSGLSGHSRHDQCDGFSVELLDAQHRNTGWNAPISFSVQNALTLSQQPIYANYNDCSNNVPMTQPINWSPSNGAEFVIKLPSTGTSVSYKALASTQVSGANLQAIPEVVNLHLAGAVLLTMEGPHQILPNVCYEYLVISKTIEYQEAPAPAVGYSFNLTASTGVSFFSDASCTSPHLNPGMIDSGNSSESIFVKIATGNSGNLGFNLTATGSNAGSISGTVPKSSYVGSGIAVPSKIHLESHNQFPVAYCQPVAVTLTNDNYTTIEPTSNIAISIEYTGGPQATLYSTANCAGGSEIGAQNAVAISGSFNFLANQTRQWIGIKAHSSGSGSLNLFRSAAPVLADQGDFNFNASGNGGTATKLKMRIEEPSAINLGACIPVFIEPLNSDDTPGMFASYKTFNFVDEGYDNTPTKTSPDSNYGAFYQSENCNGSQITSMSLQNEAKIYYKNTANGSEATSPLLQKIKLTATNIDGLAVESQLINYNASAPSSAALRISGKTNILHHSCNPYEISLIDGAGNRVKNPSVDLTVSLPTMSSFGGAFYSNYDQHCMDSTTSSGTFYTGNTTVRVNLKVTGSPSPLSSTTQTFSIASPSRSGSISLTSTNPGAPTDLRIYEYEPGWTYRKYCLGLVVAITDSSGNPSPRVSGTDLRWSSSIAGDGYFFDNEANCLNARNTTELATPNIAGVTNTISAGVTKKKYWFLNNQNSAGPANVSLNLSNTNGLTNENRSLNGFLDRRAGSYQIEHTYGSGSDTDYLNFGLCEEIRVVRMEPNSDAITDEPKVSVTLTSSESDISFHSNSNCSDAGVGSKNVIINRGNYIGTTYVKHMNLDAVSTFDGAIVDVSSLTYGSISGAATLQFNKGDITLFGPLTASGSTCVSQTLASGSYSYLRANGVPVASTLLTPIAINSDPLSNPLISFSAAIPNYYFYDSGCGSGQNSTSNGKTNGSTFYIKNNGSNASYSMTPQFDTVVYGTWFNLMPITVNLGP